MSRVPRMSTSTRAWRMVREHYTVRRRLTGHPELLTVLIDAKHACGGDLRTAIAHTAKQLRKAARQS